MSEASTGLQSPRRLSPQATRLTAQAGAKLGVIVGSLDGLAGLARAQDGSLASLEFGRPGADCPADSWCPGPGATAQVGKSPGPLLRKNVDGPPPGGRSPLLPRPLPRCPHGSSGGGESEGSCPALLPPRPAPPTSTPPTSHGPHAPHPPLSHPPLPLATTSAPPLTGPPPPNLRFQGPHPRTPAYGATTPAPPLPRPPPRAQADHLPATRIGASAPPDLLRPQLLGFQDPGPLAQPQPSRPPADPSSPSSVLESSRAKARRPAEPGPARSPLSTPSQQPPSLH
nr:uncharacterized protein LOC131275881 [Dasypus novemcinctus]